MEASHLARILKKTSERSIPIVALWELTTHCNLRCRHCYLAGVPAGPELGEAGHFLIIEKLREFGVLFLIFTGGEVFALPHFLDLARRAVELDFAVKVLTNGTLVDEHRADALASVRPLSVEVSILGREATHDALTGVAGSYRGAVAALRALARRGVRVAVKMPLMRPNRDDFPHVEELAGQLGADFLYDPQIVPSRDDRGAADGLRLDEGQMLDFLERFRGRPCGRPPSRLLCNAARNSFVIRATGDAAPCVLLPMSMGNVLASELGEIWDSPVARKMRSMGPEDLPECSGCGLAGVCCRCPAMAYLEGADMAGRSETACAMARAYSKWAKGQRQGGGFL